MNTWRIVWAYHPRDFNTQRVTFVEADSSADAIAIWQHHIETTEGRSRHSFSHYECKAYRAPAVAGRVIEGRD